MLMPPAPLRPNGIPPFGHSPSPSTWNSLGCGMAGWFGLDLVLTH